MLLSRRTLVQTGFCATMIGCATPPTSSLFAGQLVDLERRAGGRLGVSFLVPSTGASLSHSGDARFGMASTFKLALAGIILREVDQGRLSLDTLITITPADVAGHSPVVIANMDKGQLSLGALAKATQTTSDNAAANLLLRQIGGLEGFNTRMRTLGDPMTRLDRLEPMMNGVGVNDPRDTTTPAAMAKTIGKIVLTDWLSLSSKAILTDWLVETQTGLKRIRAGLPADWKSGDKTGTAAPSNPQMPDRYNDIAVAWPPSGQPMVIAAYYEPATKSSDIRDEHQATLAAVGVIGASWYRSLRA
jgi:beta-lactamase class A